MLGLNVSGYCPSGHPNNAGKKAAVRAASSSSDVLSSSDDSSDDSSNDGEDRVHSAKTLGSGKDLAFRTRFDLAKSGIIG